jgi:hypothetical protein
LEATNSQGDFIFSVTFGEFSVWKRQNMRSLNVGWRWGGVGASGAARRNAIVKARGTQGMPLGALNPNISIPLCW